MTTDILTRVGLTPEQADLYQSLLTHGAQTATGLSKTTKIGRTYIYRVGQELTKKGLIRMERKDHKTRFFPLSPDFLTTQAEEQKTKAQEAQIALESILPELKIKYGAVDNRPIITYFEGIDGIQKAHRLILAEKKEILAYVMVDEDIDKQLDAFWKSYYATRLKDNIHVRSITPDTKEGIAYKKRDQNELRETRLVPKESFPFAIEKDIVGNKIAFFSKKEGVLIATVIENKQIADTERAAFELAWKQTEHYNQ